jgi:hypothetical protein
VVFSWRGGPAFQLAGSVGEPVQPEKGSRRNVSGHCRLAVHAYHVSEGFVFYFHGLIMY